MDRLIDNTDPTSRALLQRSTWYVVPNMNPDGNYLGYHRTNRNGINLNRAWGARTTADSPETAAVEVGGPCHQFALQKRKILKLMLSDLSEVISMVADKKDFASMAHNGHTTCPQMTAAMCKKQMFLGVQS